MNTGLLYQIALTLIPQIGPVQARVLLQVLEPREIFRAKKSLLEKLEGIGSVRAGTIQNFRDFKTAEKEIAFIEQYRINPLFITDISYPRRLLNCYDAPIILYYKGQADLNASRMIAIVGTRNNSDYGRLITEKFIGELAAYDVTILSGLAYGIDAIAHKTALRHSRPTIGVLAHGLDQVYPSRHASLARDMLHANGGLLTEFRSGTPPDKHNFPARNRVVAGMSDATVVVETGIKGGSMITAELANSYNRDVFAFPGKVTDTKSAGCNLLIRDNKAVLLTEASELVNMMNWIDEKKVYKKKQKQFFIELSPDEHIIIAILQEKQIVHIDEINHRSGLSCSAVAAAILNLELQNIINCQPGKMYGLT